MCFKKLYDAKKCKTISSRRVNDAIASKVVSNGLSVAASTTETKQAFRCPTQVVDIKRTIVSYLNVDRPYREVWFPVSRPAWMSTI